MLGAPPGRIFEKLPEPLAPAPDLYTTQFNPLDAQIEQSYRAQWLFTGYSEKVFVAYPDMAMEQRVRSQFANGVFRLRVDNAVRNFLHNKEERPSAARAYELTEKVKNVQVSLDAEKKTELRMGYDVVSDFSKVEYASEHLNVGVYQGEVTTLAGGDLSPLTRGYLTVAAQLRPDLPAASIAYGWSGQSIQTSLTHALTPAVTTQISTTQPVNGSKVNQSYEVRVYFPF